MKVYKNTISKQTRIEKLAKHMILHDGEPFTNSRNISKEYGIRHVNLMRTIRDLKSFDELINSLKLRPLKYTYRGQERDYFELDEEVFILIVAKIKTKKAEQHTLDFIRAFKAVLMENVAIKATIAANQRNQQWLETRQDGKTLHRSFTDTIKAFCEYAENKRGRPYSIDKNENFTGKACPYYIHFQRITYQKADIKFSKKVKPKRDMLSGADLERVTEVEADIAVTISHLMEQGLTYKEIFKIVKGSK